MTSPFNIHVQLQSILFLSVLCVTTDSHKIMRRNHTWGHPFLKTYVSNFCIFFDPSITHVRSLNIIILAISCQVLTHPCQRLLTFLMDGPVLKTTQNKYFTYLVTPGLAEYKQIWWGQKILQAKYMCGR